MLVGVWLDPPDDRSTKGVLSASLASGTSVNKGDGINVVCRHYFRILVFSSKKFVITVMLLSKVPSWILYRSMIGEGILRIRRKFLYNSLRVVKLVALDLKLRSVK